MTDGQTDGQSRQTDRQTDRRTDGIAIAYTRYSIYAVARKNEITVYQYNIERLLMSSKPLSSRSLAASLGHQNLTTKHSFYSTLLLEVIQNNYKVL